LKRLRMKIPVWHLSHEVYFAGPRRRISIFWNAPRLSLSGKKRITKMMKPGTGI
jgi:hypothetical protein